MHVLPVPRHLPIERGALSAATTMPSRVAVAAITIDFGNTLVRVGTSALRGVVEDTVDSLGRGGVITDRAGFIAAWAEERERQFREEVPAFREPDIPHRAVRVLARLRGMAEPGPEDRWDDDAAAARVSPEDVDAVVEAYSAAFLDRIAPVADARATLERLSDRGFALAILSNWPLAVTIDRFAEAQGWGPFLRAIVVSERVGTIKPHPAIFQAAQGVLGVTPERGGLLHVGDDWAADVVGASQAGWRTAYVRDRQHDTPLPTSKRGDGADGDTIITADLEVDELSELDGLVDLAVA
jgi:HAD superfamily hydrolase (TIGR01509 family)